MHLACSEGHLDAAKLLVEEGADVNSKDRFGSTPLDDAMRGEHNEVAAYLKSNKGVNGGLEKVQAKLIERQKKNKQLTAHTLEGTHTKVCHSVSTPKFLPRFLSLSSFSRLR